MKNAAMGREAVKATRAQEDFDRWFNRSGHWLYRDREHALSTWKARGIDGLPAYPGDGR